ncbi:MAG: acyl dehydratase [Candidatus Eremiobacteraeota bacterium]|nr:acyl dehydratase [Candidatus Eremiobacteraeota bacterium]MBV8583879.1 acyl dehydratase [Candidatus Eremiobacteraeota bacterium]
MGRYLSDFTVGDAFESAGYTITDEEALVFARAYDPQPFHLYAGEAARSFFHELVISGWQTAAITMRLVVDTGVLRETGVIGTGIDELRWLAPVKPGDTLRVRGEVIGSAPWPGNGKRGTLRVRLHTVNQAGVVVMSQIANLIVPVKARAEL